MMRLGRDALLHETVFYTLRKNQYFHYKIYLLLIERHINIYINKNYFSR